MFRQNPSNPQAAQPESCLPDPSGSSTDPDPGKQQPTYTTVGSIYNPKTVTPIQPPTRRPRARRYPQPIQSPSGETYLPFPNALLSALPLDDQASLSPPTTAATLRQQYSPLQQNYDRAANPGAETVPPGFDRVEMSVPSVRSGNLPSPMVYDGTDSVTSEDNLTSLISMKSLNNLASYSNPMQKAAQKALARARTSDRGLARADSPASFSSSTPDVYKDRLPGTYGAGPAPVGPPQPLTAGPPGQRHFKPSSLETACRAHYPDCQAASMHSTANVKSPLGFSFNIGSSLLAALDDGDEVEAQYPPTHAGFAGAYHDRVARSSSEVSGFRRLSTPGPSDMTPAVPGQTRPKIHDTLPPESVEKYYPNGFPHNYEGRHRPTAENLHKHYPTIDIQMARLSHDDQISEIDRTFSASTEEWVRKTSPFVLGHGHRGVEKNVGVIGGEREQLRKSHKETWAADGGSQRRMLSVADADRMDSEEVAKPLLDLALDRLRSYKEMSMAGGSAQGTWPSGFMKAEEAWIDSSEDGYTSLFSKPKESPQKKKRVVRRPRRGY